MSRYLFKGRSNKEIARQLGISAATVKNQVHNILEKLHVHRRAEAVAALRHLGLLLEYALGGNLQPRRPVWSARAALDGMSAHRSSYFHKTH